jgi:hypothetical protein
MLRQTYCQLWEEKCGLHIPGLDKQESGLKPTEVLDLISNLKEALKEAEMELKECHGDQERTAEHETAAGQWAIDGHVSEGEISIVGGLLLVCLVLAGKLFFEKIKAQVLDLEMTIASKAKQDIGA